MTAKKVEDPPVVPDTAPMSFRDFADVPESEPVQIAYPHDEPVVTEPAKPAVKKEN